MNNPLKTLSAHGARIDMLEKLGIGNSDLIDQLIKGLENSLRLDLQHSQRINELEQQSASQLKRIENLEGCIRTQAENQRVTAQELSRLSIEAQRNRPLGPFGPIEPARPGPSPFWGGSNIALAASGRLDDASLHARRTMNWLAGLTEEQFDQRGSLPKDWMADALAADAILSPVSVARMSTLPVGRELTEGETPQ